MESHLKLECSLFTPKTEHDDRHFPTPQSGQRHCSDSSIATTLRLLIPTTIDKHARLPAQFLPDATQIYQSPPDGREQASTAQSATNLNDGDRRTATSEHHSQPSRGGRGRETHLTSACRRRPTSRRAARPRRQPPLRPRPPSSPTPPSGGAWPRAAAAWRGRGGIGRSGPEARG